VNTGGEASEKRTGQTNSQFSEIPGPTTILRVQGRSSRAERAKNVCSLCCSMLMDMEVKTL